MRTLRELRFEEAEPRQGFGILTIEGLDLPTNSVYNNTDAIAKIWSSIRKRNYKRLKVDSAASIFNEGDKIKCSFQVSTANIDDKLVKLYINRFDETWWDQIESFETALSCFMQDPNGFEKLKNYLITADQIEFSKCEELLEDFLRAHGFKTKGDDKRKKAKKAALKNAQIKKSK